MPDYKYSVYKLDNIYEYRLFYFGCSDFVCW